MMDSTGNDQIAEVYFGRGGSKCEVQDFAGAIAEYTKAIEMNSTFAEAYHISVPVKTTATIRF